jgi:ribosomal protein S1
MREGTVVRLGRSCAVVRLDGDGSPAIVPWEELSWWPSLDPPSLRAGDHVAGRVVGLTLDGPVLSPRAVTPSPWPAVALALPVGTTVSVRVEASDGARALVRTDRAPRALAVVAAAHLEPGATLEATVTGVDATAETLELSLPEARAPRHAREARTPGPRGPERAV